MQQDEVEFAFSVICTDEKWRIRIYWFSLETTNYIKVGFYIIMNIDGRNSQVVSSRLLVNHQESQYKILSLFSSVFTCYCIIICYFIIFTFYHTQCTAIVSIRKLSNILWTFHLTTICNAIFASIVTYCISSDVSEIVLYDKI